MSSIRRMLPLAVLLAALAGAAAAQPEDPERGRALAERWCSDCHVVAPDVPGGDTGPPFSRLMTVEGRSRAALEAWLFEPHGPMEGMELTPDQIADIVAHIEALDQ